MKKGEHWEEPIETVLTATQLEKFAAVAEAAAADIVQPGAYSGEGVAFDAEGKSVGLWSADAVQLDALGWIFRAAAFVLGDYTENRNLCVRASVHIGLRVHLLTGRSFIEINDADGAEAVAEALLKAAASFRQELQGREADGSLRAQGYRKHHLTGARIG